MLEDYQNAQKEVEKQLSKEHAKQSSKLENELKARRARRKNQAQLKKTEKFNEIEAEAATKVAQDLEDRDKLKENLRAADEDEGGYASKLSHQVNNNVLLIDEMEQKRRDEEAFRAQQERLQRKMQGENLRDTAQDDKAVEAEIQKLADGEVYDTFNTHTKERQRLTEEIENAADEGERARLMAELNNVDARVA